MDASQVEMLTLRKNIKSKYGSFLGFYIFKLVYSSKMINKYGFKYFLSKLFLKFKIK